MVNNQKREIKLKDIDNYNVRYGTLDKFNPEVIYITAKTKIKPLEKKGSYAKDVAVIKSNFIEFVDKLIKESEDFNDKYICHFETNENGMVYNKRSYVKYLIYIKPKKIMYIDDYEKDIREIVSRLNDVLSVQLSQNGMFHV